MVTRFFPDHMPTQFLESIPSFEFAWGDRRTFGPSGRYIRELMCEDILGKQAPTYHTRVDPDETWYMIRESAIPIVDFIDDPLHYTHLIAHPLHIMVLASEAEAQKELSEKVSQFTRFPLDNELKYNIQGGAIYSNWAYWRQFISDPLNSNGLEAWHRANFVVYRDDEMAPLIPWFAQPLYATGDWITLVPISPSATDSEIKESLERAYIEHYLGYLAPTPGSSDQDSGS